MFGAFGQLTKKVFIMKIFSYVFLLSFALIFTSCSKQKDENSSNNTKKEAKKTQVMQNKSNNITLTTVNGEKIEVTKEAKGFTFSNAQNQIILIDFFATWCPPCKAEIPHLNNLQEKYKGKIKIIGVLIEQNKDSGELKKFMNNFAINYTIVNSSANQLFADAVGGIESIPFMIMYGKNGKNITHYLGVVPEEMIDSDIQSALKK